MFDILKFIWGVSDFPDIDWSVSAISDNWSVWHLLVQEVTGLVKIAPKKWVAVAEELSILSVLYLIIFFNLSTID